MNRPSTRSLLPAVSRPASAFASTMGPYLRVAALLPKVSRRLAAALAVLVLASVTLPVLVTIATGQIVGAVPDAIDGGSDSSSTRTVLLWLAVLGTSVTLFAPTFQVRAAVAHALGERLEQFLAQRVMEALNRPIGIAHLEDPEVQDLVRRARSLVGFGGHLPGAVVQALSNQAGIWLLSISYTIVLAQFNVLLAIALFVVTVVVAVIQRRDFLRVTAVMANRAGAVRRSDYLRDLAMRPDAAREVRIWGLLPWLTSRFSSEWRQFMDPAWLERSSGNRTFVLTVIVMFAVYGLILVLVALAAADGEIGLAALVIYIQAAGSIDSIAIRGGDDFALDQATDALPALEALEQRLADAETGLARGARSPTGMPVSGIEFERVSFRYPGSSSDVVRDMSLSIPAGRSLALVGANGAGKSTLVKLLGRLYEPGEGRITVDGVDIREFDSLRWQRRISAVFQDFEHYELSARDNVALGAVDHVGAESALHRAASEAGIDEVIDRLPLGWETRLSRQYRDGAEISGGEWQRVALARALFAVSGGAGVLILDEPTANLDVRAEAALYDRFLDITHGLTTIIVSHRFSTVRRADRIVVIESGGIVEDGTHDELLALGGEYSRMFRLQAARFDPGDVGV